MIGDLKGLAFEYKENGRTLILGGGFSIEIFLKIEKKRVWNFLRVEFFAGQRMIIGSTLLLREGLTDGYPLN